MEQIISEKLTNIASELRKDIVRMVGVARSGPISIPLSITDILVYLYWEEMLVVAGDAERPDRDRFLLGIPEGVPALYAALARRGYFEREELWHYRRLGAMLQSMPEFSRVPGIDGMSVIYGNEAAVAVGLAKSINGKSDSRVFCLSNIVDLEDTDFWSTAELAAEEELGRIMLLLVAGKKAATGGEKIVTNKKRFAGIGWDIHSADGHDFKNLGNIFSDVDWSNGHPKVLFISVLEDNGIFDDLPSVKISKSLSIEAMDQVLEELEAKSNEQ